MSSEDKKEYILHLVSSLMKEKTAKKWQKGKDWVEYSGPHFDEKEYVSAVETLLGGWLIFGENAREFEKKFPVHLGKKHGVFTNSGSSANLLMMAAARSRNLYNFQPGTKIITPVVCFPTTINPIIQNGFEPIFVDVELPSLNLNLDDVEKKLKEHPDIKAITFAHVLGNPPDMDRLMKIIIEHDLIFLEDSCDALGSTYKGKKLGSFGHMSACSFFPAHHMTTGEGGFVATDSGRARLTLASIRDWGRACYCNTTKPGNVTCGTACGDRFKNWLPGMKDVNYDHRYVFDEIGYNLKPLDLQASIGLRQLDKLPEMDSARRENHKKLYDIFSKYEQYFILPKATEGSDPCWFGFSLIVKDNSPFTKHEFVKFLEFHKIQTRSYFSGNILLHPGYHHMAEKYGDMDENFPIAQKVTRDCFFLGTFIGLTQDKIDYIKEIVDLFFDTKVGVG
jgi:CDP-6-deoxy-D-xylo-4-hexulose-3-dehydrase